MAIKRITPSSVSGKKLYAVRNADGTFGPIQDYSKVHTSNKTKKSKPDTKKAVKKVVKKTGGNKSYEVNITLKFSTARGLKEFLELLGDKI